jgi:hypothetical protein
MKHKKKLIKSAKARVICIAQPMFPQLEFFPMTTVCGTWGNIRFCGQKQTLIFCIKLLQTDI